MPLHTGSPSSRLRHVPRDKLAARPAAEHENLQLLCLSHMFLLFFVIAVAGVHRCVAQLQQLLHFDRQVSDRAPAGSTNAPSDARREIVAAPSGSYGLE